MNVKERVIRLPDVIEFAPHIEAVPRSDLSRAVDGAQFICQVPDQVPALWGSDGESVLWAQGEPLMIVGPDGVGKTSVAQQLVLCRIGIRDHLLGLPVKQARGKVLYIAADRPRQAASSMRRMVCPADNDLLRARLIVWKGPLPERIVGNPQALVNLATDLGATDIVIDSLKDIAPDLIKDETGSHVNIAFQEVIASDRELLVLHHQRKAQQGAGKPRSLADVYGSRWLTAGMGSVICLWGDAGDLIVDLTHLKQPSEEVGPIAVLHDHTSGRSTVHQTADLEQALAEAGHGVIVHDAARLMFSTETPDRNQIEKARRRLEGLAKKGRADRRDDPDGLARYFAPPSTAETTNETTLRKGA